MSVVVECLSSEAFLHQLKDILPDKVYKTEVKTHQSVGRNRTVSPTISHPPLPYILPPLRVYNDIFELQ
ncbi:MAG: hypothetical protein NZ901_02180 [Geminocystis sp.]|nr:hypothetical protein [Geminocystis sp.]HIK37876.1 hypothetical protein [Geminocystis sp. M7585_C2015_104]MCS7146977.1 hypothetical protein [Geminocystis sp.]MCX8077289.1 hypothetical protein [Geminocystis sp.]MDW8115801.1 hypothetical protein [Geminocystis sp.]